MILSARYDAVTRDVSVMIDDDYVDREFFHTTAMEAVEAALELLRASGYNVGHGVSGDGTRTIRAVYRAPIQ